MNLKEKLLEFKKRLLADELPVSRDFEFDATFENHPIGNQDIYRLYFIDYHRINEYVGRQDNNVGVITWPCNTFRFPEEMSREEGFKVLSYLIDFTEKIDCTKPWFYKSTRALDGVFGLERFGFKRVKENDEDKILNLFMVSGRLLLFKRSELYSKYFDWYVENVTLEEVTNIYAKHNMELRNIECFDNQNDKEYSKVLKQQK